MVQLKRKLQYGITYFFIGILIVACLLFSGCNGSKSAVRKLARIDSRHKPVVDGYFAMTRPCVDSVHEVYINDTIVRPSETKYITLNIDSLIDAVLPIPENCDSLLWETKKRLSLGKGEKVNLPCPPCDSTWIINTYKSKFQKQTDKSKEGVYQEKIRIATEALNKEQVEHSATKQSLKTYKTGFSILLAIIAVYVVIKLFWGKITGWFGRK